ncbi:MAG TPA: hypothetical protein C5S51_03585 [Methanosarcinaceae archaeon]|nr:hypothetical protein [Methanosarcinaceae archaeon]
MAIENLKPCKKYKFAIDCTNDPYYGKIDTPNDKYVIRGQAKNSTNSFYSYISLYIINKNKRFTIYVLPVEKGKSKVECLGYFIGQIKRLDIGFEILYLDRELYKFDVFDFLQKQNVPYIPSLTVTVDYMKSGAKNFIYANFDPMNTLILRGKQGITYNYGL